MKKHNGGTQLPLITPESLWKRIDSLPDLRNCKRLALDTEERDDSLGDGMGSGWPYEGRGYILGMSIAWQGGAFYAPMNHPETNNFQDHVVGRWLKDHVDAGCKFVTHHGAYDWGWIWRQWGIPCPSNLDDTEAMAMMVDENRLSYSLDALCEWRGLVGKDERGLREAAAAYGVDPKSEMYLMPARYIGPYAEQDARALLPLADNLMEVIREEKTEAAYRLEMDLVPTVWAMRKRGIRIDVDAAARLHKELEAERDKVLTELSGHVGKRMGMDECRSTRVLEPLFQSEKIPFPRTEKTNQGSFKAQWMRKHPHWLPRLVSRAEQLEEAANKFVQGFILKYIDQGRLHAHINQYRGEEGGTRSFRFSYADPPLQQMPSRDGELASAIRGLFLPEPGERWAAIDYSQQEYRLIVHYASLLGTTKSREAVERYRQDPKTDFHALVSDWTGLERKPAKDANFAKAFGAGVTKFAEMINKTREEAKEIYEQYDRELPFVSQAARRCQETADRKGFIKLIDGTRSHFDSWEPAWREPGEAYAPPGPLPYARTKWPERRLRRAFTHKAMNRLIQGSAARQTKAAIRDCAKEGYLPLIQMHDELGFSYSAKDQVTKISELMKSAIPLEVPMQVDAETGETWGSVK